MIKLGGAPSFRPYSQIIEEEKSQRNILEIHLRKVILQDQVNSKPKNLSFDDIGDFIFDILKVNPDDCLGFDYTTGRYDSRQLKLKPSVNATPYITSTPILFKHHEISVSKQLNNVTRVFFKNVPLNVPDEEILHLCLCYGSPVDHKVHVEKLTNSRNKGMPGSNRYVDMHIKDSMSFENYYWMEGPLSGDSGRRITVLHNGQTKQQCFHCLQRADPRPGHGCPGGGNGKMCEDLKTVRGKMSHYMQSLRMTVGYVSLKIRYFEQQSKNFPPLNKAASANVEGYADMDRDQGLDENHTDVLPLNPIEEKDKKILELEKQIDDLRNDAGEVPALREGLTKVNAELKMMKANSRSSMRRLSFAKNVTEQRMVDIILDESPFQDPHLASVYSATLNEDEFEIDETTNLVKPLSDNFLKKVEENCDLSNNHQKEKLDTLKHQILEKVKVTKARRDRSRSVSSVSSGKRGADQVLENKSPARPRVTSPKKN